MKINVAEIFQSIDGEVNYYHQGRQTVFLRLAGCNFDGVFIPPCPYCDTKEYQHKDSGREFEIYELADALSSFKSENLTITGGEPLMQWKALMRFFNSPESQQWKKVSIETNGSIPLPRYRSLIARPLSFVIDVKLTRPQIDHMDQNNWRLALNWDWFKMVVNKENFYEALMIYRVIRKVNQSGVGVAFSPEYHGDLNRYAKDAQTLIALLEKNEVSDVVVNLQLHQIIKVQ